MGRAKRIWYLSPMRAAKVQASLRIRAVSPEPSLLAYTSSESRGTFRQKASSLAPLNGWACAVEICHDGMLEDTNSLDGAHMNMRRKLAPRFNLKQLSTPREDTVSLRPSIRRTHRPKPRPTGSNLTNPQARRPLILQYNCKFGIF